MKNKVLNGVDLLIEDSYEAEEGLSDTARAVGGLDYCLYAAITLYDEIKYEAKCLKARSEREIDTYAILMADPDSYTYKQAVHAEKEQDLRRACDEGMIKIRQANTQENMEAYWLTKKNFAEWQDENKMLNAVSLKETHESRAKLSTKLKQTQKPAFSTEPAKILVSRQCPLNWHPDGRSQTAPALPILSPMSTPPTNGPWTRVAQSTSRVVATSRRRRQKSSFRSRSGLPFAN